MAGLTDQDKERCRYHTGYMETSFAPTLQFGSARPMQTMFLLEQALNLMVNPYAIARLRTVLETLDQIEQQLVSPGVELLYAKKLGELELREATHGMTSTDLIEREYVRWAKRLADILGVPLYPYSERFKRRGPGNVTVRH